MRKLTLSLAALGVVGLAAGTVAYAQQGPRGDGPRQHMAAVSPENFQSLVDARIAALQAGLKLTDAQKALWGPVEAAVRKAAQARFDAMQGRHDRRDEDRGDFMQRLERRATMADTFAASSKELAAAMKPLWATLDERQKQLLPMLIGPAGFGGNAVPLGGGHDRGHHKGEHRRGDHGGPGFERFGEHRGHGPMMGPGYGRMMFEQPTDDDLPADPAPAAPIRG
jgi:zinc resistance-associated protein